MNLSDNASHKVLFHESFQVFICRYIHGCLQDCGPYCEVHLSIWEQNGSAVLEGWWINVIINGYKDSIESLILLIHTFLKGRLFKMQIPYLKSNKSFTFHFAFLDAYLFSLEEQLREQKEIKDL